MIWYMRVQIQTFLKTLGSIDLSLEVNQIGYLVQRCTCTQESSIWFSLITTLPYIKQLPRFFI